MELDPFSQVGTALWKMVGAHTSLRDLILPGNMIKYDSEESQKDQISSADTPELALLISGFDPGKTNSSTETSLIRMYTWAITSGDLRVDQYNQVAWELFRAMVPWSVYLCPLTWKTRRFVNNFRMLSSQEGTMRRDVNRGIRGWTSLWDFEVHYSFCTKEL